MKRSPIIALVLFAALTTKAQAAPIYVDLGTAAPPGTLGGYVMTSFPDDPRPLFTDVTSVPSPLGGDLTFSTAVNLLEIGSGWATWSHGYTGDVYYSNGATSLGLGLPADTGAFYFYAEPNPFSTFIFTVTASDGTTTTVTQPIAGAFGARGFGFYSTSGAITSILVSSSVDFAIGEFGIARLEEVPEPAIVVLLGIGAAAVGIRRRRTLPGAVDLGGSSSQQSQVWSLSLKADHRRKAGDLPSWSRAGRPQAIETRWRLGRVRASRPNVQDVRLSKS